MKTAYQQAYGDTDVLQVDDSLPRPEVRKTDLLLKMRYACLNPIDLHIRGGYGRQIMERRREAVWPLVLGRDGVGEVIDVGAKAKGFRVGDLVAFAIGPQDQGSCAEYCRVPYTTAAAVPAGVDIRDAASMSYVALTSWRALVDIAGVEPGTCQGKRILVHAGAGGVGSFAIQLLKLWGATVLTTCSAGNLEKVTALGADQAIDYNAERFEEAAGAVDGVFDTIGNDYEKRSLGIIQRGGFYTSVVTPLVTNITEKGIPRGLLSSAATFTRQKLSCRKRGIRYGWSLFQPNGEALAYVMQCLENDQLSANIDREYPLESIIEAHQYLATGHASGKVMIALS